MMERIEGCLAKSLAGHDKGSLYIIIRTEGEYVYLSDGRHHPVDKPKTKNRKHIQLVCRYDGGIRERLIEGIGIRNEEIIHFIRTQKQ